MNSYDALILRMRVALEGTLLVLAASFFSFVIVAALGSFGRYNYIAGIICLGALLISMYLVQRYFYHNNRSALAATALSWSVVVMSAIISLLIVGYGGAALFITGGFFDLGLVILLMWAVGGVSIVLTYIGLSIVLKKYFHLHPRKEAIVYGKDVTLLMIKQLASALLIAVGLLMATHWSMRLLRPHINELERTYNELQQKERSQYQEYLSCFKYPEGTCGNAHDAKQALYTTREHVEEQRKLINDWRQEKFFLLAVIAVILVFAGTFFMPIAWGTPIVLGGLFALAYNAFVSIDAVNPWFFIPIIMAMLVLISIDLWRYPRTRV